MEELEDEVEEQEEEEVAVFPSTPPVHPMEVPNTGAHCGQGTHSRSLSGDSVVVVVVDHVVSLEGLSLHYLNLSIYLSIDPSPPPHDPPSGRSIDG